jgi:hypothetical protein
MHEAIEGQGHGAHADHPLTLPVTITLSILAVLVAAVTLLGHRAHTEELLLQAQASDQWAYYQAKSIRSREMHSMVDLLDSLASKDSAKTEKLLDKYEKEGDRYEREKDEISEKAKELESERDALRRRADRFDAGEGFLEVGLIICSITMLTKRRIFWFGGMLVGAVGVLTALTGLFLH